MSNTNFKLKSKYPFYLGNEPVYENTNLQVINKYTSQPVTCVSVADEKTISKAIQMAYDSQEALRKMSSYERKEILEYVVQEVKKRFDEFAYTLCIEAGKPLKDARGEVNRLIDTFTIAAEEATRVYGEYIPLDISERAKGMSCITKRFPVGPVSMISPFNFPLNLTAHKIAPAIAVGCPWVLKPASKTPLGALLLGEILSGTKLPKGSFSILPCSRDGAELFTTDERFKLLSFTGSPAVGWELKKKAGKKKVVLELGGNAACIVDKDADLDYVTERIIVGAFYQSGQSCISVQRVYIHADIYDELKKKLIEKTKTLKMGDPLQIDTFIGPIIDEKEAKRIEEWINEAKEKGGKVLVGGSRKGVFVEPTIMENVDKNCKIYKEEVFGPAFIIEKFVDFKKAIDAVNDSDYGLQAGIFSKNIDKCFYAFEKLDVGGVVINDVPSIRVDSQPYGGIKNSGIGREGIRFAIEDMTELRTMILKNVGMN